MKKISLLLLVVTSTFLLTSCIDENQTSSSTSEDDNTISININDKDGESVNIKIENKDDLKEALKGLEDAFQDLGEELGNINVDIEDENGKKIETVEAKELKKILPRRVAGMGQTESSSQKNGAFGYSVATAQATYGEGDEKVNVAIVDVGGMGKLASKWAKWSTVEIDKESSDGSFERTTTLEGHKAFEKYDARRERYEVAALVDDRFVVTLEGKNVKLRKLKYAFEDIADDLEDL